MLAGMELDLFTVLKDGALTAEQLAEKMSVQTDKLNPLLYSLVVAGLLTVDDGLFANTAETDHYLVRGRSRYVGGLQELTVNNWRRVIRTAETIRAGRPLAEYDYHSTQDELIALFKGLYSGARSDAKRLMKRYDFSAYSTLLDVGGGSGALAITMAQGNPQLKATVLDLPSITPITQQFVAETEVADRVHILSADAVRDSLVGMYDAVVVRHVVQVLSADEGCALLRNLSTILKPGGMIYLIGWVLDDSRLSPQNIVGYNLVLLNAYQNGQAYTEQEYRGWLVEAGFVAFERVVLPDGVSIVTAQKYA